LGRFNEHRISDVRFAGMLEHSFSNIFQTAASHVGQPARSIQDLDRVAVATTCSEFGRAGQGDVQQRVVDPRFDDSGLWTAVLRHVESLNEPVAMRFVTAAET